MSKRFTVFPDGRVAQPFDVVKQKGLQVSFYANRGKFEFVFQDSENGMWRHPVQFQVSTRTIRKALRLVDSRR